MLRSDDPQSMRAFVRIMGTPIMWDGHGHVLKAVLDAAPKATGVRFEQPHVVAAVEGLASERLHLQGGTFFEDAMPICDAYVPMRVLHDWDDASAGTLLAAIRKAAPPDAKLLVTETILLEDRGPHWARLLDMQMLTMHTGRERTRGVRRTAGWSTVPP